MSDNLQMTINRLRELLEDEPEEWRIDRRPHKYPDGSDHFTDVIYTVYDCGRAPMTVIVADYLTDELAELLVTTKNNLHELLRIAEIGLEAERANS